MRALTIGCAISFLAAASAFAQFGETITVSRVLVDVRVTDNRGTPLRDLTPDDFIVRIGEAASRVESVTFIDETTNWIDEPASIPDETGDEPNSPRGRLFVVFVQTDFARNATRVSGQMHFNRYAEHFIQSLQPDDRVAVFSFDSHLKFRLDFSNDKEAIRAAARNTIWIDHPPPPPVVPAPSLASRLDREAMRRAAHSETAIQLVANALAPIPGPKSMILLGWGLGELTPIGVKMKVEWKPARLALDAARVSIFALDTTYADYHDLEFGLQSAAEETGGFYAKTHIFPRVALQRLQRTLSGHYELTLRAPGELKIGSRTLDVRVKRRGARVLAPQSVIIRN